MVRQNDIGRTERWIRKHRKTIIVGAVGFALGCMFTNRRYRNHISTDFANKIMKETFEQVQGDFSNGIGGYFVPRFKVVS